MSKRNGSESCNIVSHCEQYWRSLRMYNVIDAILFEIFFSKANLILIYLPH